MSYNVNYSSQKSLVVKIVCWSLALVLLLAVFITAMALTGGNNFGGGIYADADSYSVGSREYTEIISSLEINWTSGALEILPYDGSSVKLEEDGAKNPDDELRSKTVGSKLIVQYVKSGFALFRTVPEKNLKVYVPRDMARALDRIEIDSSSALAALNELNVNSIDIDTASGAVNLTSVNARVLDVDTASGSFFAKGEYGSLSVDTASGDVTVQGSANTAEIDCASGNVELVGNIAKCEIDTSSGDVRIVGAPTSAEIDTGSGNVTLEFPLDTVGIDVDFDGGSGRLYINEGGNVFETNHFVSGSPIKHRIDIDTGSGDANIKIG